MAKIDDIFSRASEKADDAEVLNSIVERLSILMNVDEDLPNGQYVLSESKGMLWHRVGELQDDKGRVASAELGIMRDRKAKEEIRLDFSSSETDHDALMSRAEALAKSKSEGASIRLSMSMDLRGANQSVRAGEILGRLVGFDEQRRPIIVNSDWDNADEQERNEKDIPLFLDPESDRYQEVVLLMYGAADTEIEKLKGKS